MTEPSSPIAETVPGVTPPGGAGAARPAAMGILTAISVSHLLNDSVQAVLPAIYPMLKETFRLDFVQVGLITLTFQLTASILQPLVGLYTDRHPKPFSLAWGMGLTLVGLALLAFAGSFAMVLVAAGTIGLGSSVFHPEASRVARLASGGRHGLAQSLFQVGGNAGTALGPLLAALVVVPRGQSAVLWFGLIALAGIVVLARVGRWYRAWVADCRARGGMRGGSTTGGMPGRRVWMAMSVLLALMFSKFFYLASVTNFYTFYQIERFQVSVPRAQISLFIFLAAVAAGTIIGGPVGDRIGRKKVIWVSIAGIAPFTLALPHVGFTWMIILSVLIGAIQASAFSAILVYAQELIPGRVGLVSGLFFGLAFGLAGIASALLGELADRTSIDFVFRVCAYLPLIGLLAVFLPAERRGTT